MDSIERRKSRKRRQKQTFLAGQKTKLTFHKNLFVPQMVFSRIQDLAVNFSALVRSVDDQPNTGETMTGDTRKIIDQIQQQQKKNRYFITHRN